MNEKSFKDLIVIEIMVVIVVFTDACVTVTIDPNTLVHTVLVLKSLRVVVLVSFVRGHGYMVCEMH